jgi:hypothetical protein
MRILVLLMLLNGCAITNLLLVPHNEDKDNGIVEMKFEYDPRESVIINSGNINEEVLSKCTDWGYASVDKVVSEEIKCVEFSSDKCVLKEAIRTYRCLTNKGF